MMNRQLLMMVLSSIVGIFYMITTTTASTTTTSNNNMRDHDVVNNMKDPTLLRLAMTASIEQHHHDEENEEEGEQQQHHRQLIRQPGAETRIVGGEQSTAKQFPYFVDLRRITCGGSLIAPRVVLTAAHCDLNTNLIGQQVIVGAYENNVGNNAGTNNDYGSVTVRVVDEAPHPEYDLTTEDNDLLLLLLAVPIYIEEPTLTISTDKDYYAPRKNTDVTAIGLGLLQQGGTTRPDFVRHVVVPVVDPDLCGLLYEDGGNDSFNGSTMFCAGDIANGGIDTCQGDSGGPIVDASSPTQHIQYGVTSWGLGCARPGFPGIYAKTGSSIDWIRSIVCSQEGWNVYADFCDPADQITDAPTNAPTQDCPDGEFLVDWRFHTDGFGGETSWDLSDISGSGIQSGKYDTYLDDEQYRFQICLPCDGRYILSLFDLQGDGYCCGGNPSYNLIVDGEVLADAKVGDEGIDWGRNINWEFTGNSSCPTPSPTPNPSSAPTPAPTPSPTPDPSPSPTESPTQSPTLPPSVPPTTEPTPGPSVPPTAEPTPGPSVQLPSADVRSQGPVGGAETPPPPSSPPPVASVIAPESSTLAKSAGATIRNGPMGGMVLLAIVVLFVAR